MRLSRKTGQNEGVRRPRTLIEEERLPVQSTFTYSSRRSEQLQNQGRANAPAEVKSKPFWLARLGLIILILALIASAISLLTLSSTPVIEPAISGQSLSISQKRTYQTAASHLLGNSIFDS